MAEIIGLVTAQAKIDESVVMRLEDALSDAKAGKIAAIAIACVTPDGATYCSWSASFKFIELLGAVSRMQYRLNATQDDA